MLVAELCTATPFVDTIYFRVPAVLITSPVRTARLTFIAADRIPVRC